MDSGSSRKRGAVIAVSSNKGGVGKTTVASNLAVYLRAVDEGLPVLVIGLDDQGTLDRMFQLRPPQPGQPNLKHAWAERSLERAVQLGEYGVHFVASPRDSILLKARAEDSSTLRRMLERLAWPGLVILDTKSDLEALTRNALHAADRILIPVCDWAALLEAAKSFDYLARSGLGIHRGRVVLTLVDSRTRMSGGGEHLDEALGAEIRKRGWPCYATELSRSPRVEALNSLHGKPRSILHHATGTRVQRQMRELTEEVLADLGMPRPVAGTGLGSRNPAAGRARATPRGAGGLKSVLLRGLAAGSVRRSWPGSD